MDVTLFPLEPDAACRRFFIRADGQHAGGITVHSVQGNRFSYGIAITPSLRRRGIAGAALPLLFERMKRLGFQHAVAQVAPADVDEVLYVPASLALHRSLGFEVASKDISAITLKKIL